MKSCLRICVVISTMLVLSTSNPQNYRRPDYDQRWNPEHRNQPPVRQWRNYQTPAQPSSDPEVANYQPFQQYPTAREPVVVNADEVPQTVHHADHAHTIRKVSVPLKDLEKHKGARIVHLPGTGNKGVRVLRVNVDTGEVYEEKNITGSLKLIIDKALAANKGEAETETIHPDPVTQEDNAENEPHFAAYRPVWPRRRFRNPNGFSRPNVGYPFRRRRPFQINHNAPLQGVRRPAQVLVLNDNEEILDNPRSAAQVDVVTPENTKVDRIDDDEKTMVTVENPEVVSEFTDKQTTEANEQSTGIQQSVKNSPKNAVQSSIISSLIKDLDNVPVGDEPPTISDEESTFTTTVTITEPIPVSSEEDDSVESKYIVYPISSSTDSSESEELETTTADDDSFETRSGRTLLTTANETDSMIVPLSDIIKTKKDKLNNNVTAIQQKQTDAEENSNIESIIATDLTTKFTKPSTMINNEDDSDKSDNIDHNNINITELESTLPSTNQKHTPVQVPLQVSKSLGNYPKTTLHAQPSFNNKNPIEEIKKSSLSYVIISPLKAENATKEESLFKTLIDFLIGKKKNNRTLDNKELENHEDKTKLLLERDNQFRRMYKISSKPVQKTHTEVLNNETETGNLDASEKSINDVAEIENVALTPISFLSRLVQSAFNGGDSLKNLFGEQRVKDFIIRLSKLSSN